jgi:hypothetical protein
LYFQADALDWQLCPPLHEHHSVLGIIDKFEYEEKKEVGTDGDVVVSGEL